MHMMRSQNTRGTSKRGQAMVEFGLVVGLFMLVIGGLIQFGIIFWTQNAITQIARDTARYAVTLSNSPCDSAATRSLVGTAADRLARSANLAGYVPWTSAVPRSSLGPEGVGADWIVPDDLDLAGNPIYGPGDCPPSDNGIAVYVRIQINHAVPIFLPGLQIFAPSCPGGGFCLSTEAELRMEPKKR